MKGLKPKFTTDRVIVGLRTSYITPQEEQCKLADSERS